MPQPIRYTAKEESLFIEEYISNGFIAAWAYKKVFPDICEQLSTGAIQKRAERLKNKLEPRIAARRKKIYKDLHIDAERVLTELAHIGFIPLGNEFVLTRDKIKALELLGKNLGLWEKQAEAASAQITITLED